MVINKWIDLFENSFNRSTDSLDIVEPPEPKSIYHGVKIRESKMFQHAVTNTNDLAKNIIDRHNNGNTPTRGEVLKAVCYRRVDPEQIEPPEVMTQCEEFSNEFNKDCFSESQHDCEVESNIRDSDPFPVEKLIGHIAQERLKGCRISVLEIIEMALS